MVAPVVTAAGIGAAADLVGGVFGGFSAKSANKQAKKMAREQMAFQERMSNTAHQREVADLKAAGLNPILSAGGSGASSPGGQTAPVLPVNYGSGIGKAGSRAMQATMNRQTIAASAKQMDLADSQITSNQSAAEASSAQARKTDAETALITGTSGSKTTGAAADAQYAIKRLDLLAAQIEESNSARDRNLAEAEFKDTLNEFYPVLKAVGLAISGGAAAGAAYKLYRQVRTTKAAVNAAKGIKSNPVTVRTADQGPSASQNKRMVDQDWNKHLGNRWKRKRR